MYYRDLYVQQFGYYRYAVVGIPRDKLSSVVVSWHYEEWYNNGMDGAREAAEEYIDFLVARGCGERRK